MAIRIKSRGGESVEQMLRRFKKLCEKEGLTKDIKRKEFYEKPSERKTREKAEAIRRNRKAARKQAIREGLIAAPKPKPRFAGPRRPGASPSTTPKQV